jgi:hypothetical protein
VEQQQLLEDIEDWKSNWRRTTGRRETPISNESTRSIESGPARLEGYVSSTIDDTRSTISLNNGQQLIITRAASRRSTPFRAEIDSSSSVDNMVDSESVAEEEENQAAHESDGADDETVTQETVPLHEKAPKSAWDQLWDDLADFAGIHDQGN